MSSRQKPLDALRGLAVMAMIIFHGVWDLDAYWMNLAVSDRAWLIGGSIIGGAFLFISGVSASLYLNDAQKLKKKGLIAFLMGLAVSAVSFFILPHSPIYFGILHCIGASLFFSAYFRGRRPVFLSAVVFSSLLGIATEFVTGLGPYFTWAGITYPGFNSSDYFPIFPWSGVLFLGVLMGPRVIQLTRGLRVPQLLQFLGRHSLIIYLIHQPILVGLLKLLPKR